MKNKTVKKLTLYILSIIFLLSLISCNELKECDHQWGEWTVLQSFCDKPGIQERECKNCKKKEVAESPIHNLRYNAARPVTCTRKGWDEYVSCKDCNYTTYKEIAPLDHNYENNYCKNCGRTALSMGIIRGEVHAFGIGCYEGENLVIPAQHKGYPVTKIGLNGFQSVYKLKNVTFPNTITNFEFGAFDYCQQLEMAVLPESVKNNSAGFFYNSSKNMSIVYVPDSELEGYIMSEVQETEEDTLLEIEIINNIGVVKGLGSFEGENIVIPETYQGRDVQRIAANAFEGCTHIRSVVMPYRISRIENRAFAGCTGLKEVIFDTSNSGTTVKFAEDSFAGCSDIHLEIPWDISDDLMCFKEAVVTATIHTGTNGWTSIYPSVKKASWDTDEIKSASVSCIKYFNNLKTLIIGDDVTGIWDFAFMNCNNFEELIISGNVMKMGQNVFSGCRYLKKVTLKKGISSISANAFENCIRLKECIVEQTFDWNTNDNISHPAVAANWLLTKVAKHRPAKNALNR